jgi:cytochrome c5
MARRRMLLIAALVAASLPAAVAADREGSQVYTRNCAVCHAQGREGAPRVGDAKAWSKLSARGLSSLTESALAGVRKMPPHGGKLDLSDLDVRRAIVHMVNESGGQWVEPADRRRPPVARTGEQIVQAQCLKCHADGREGAPRLGDNKAWVDRAKHGFDNLTQSALRGHGGMPARGGMADLTDAEVRNAVAYMVETSLRSPKPR